LAPVIALAGFMGSGKTTVGRRVARLLHWTFLDLDVEVAASSGRSIPSIFDEEGEAGFRHRECDALRLVLQRTPQEEGLVLALGGGTVTSPDALDCLKGRARVVYLEVDAESAWRRVSRSDRPLARDRQAFAGLLDERRVIYEAAADVIIDTRQKSVEAIAREVATTVRAAGGDEP
jgi:shikimate kinase